MKHQIPTVKETSNCLRWLILLAIAAVVIGILWFKSWDQGLTDSGLSPGVIYAATTRTVADHLKAPATAKFAPFYDARGSVVDFRSLGNKRYSVSSYVDSQNAFGANVRTRWTAIVSVSGEKVTVEALQTAPP